jgi:signal transduction histidine kinase
MTPRPQAQRRARFGGWLFRSGSLTRRMLAVATVWIISLLLIGGFVLERAIVSIIERNFDAQIVAALNALIASAEIGPQGEVRLDRALGDQRFQEPYSGLYWQISTAGQEPFRSRSLWDRALVPRTNISAEDVVAYDSNRFDGEPLRVVERRAVLPASPVVFTFQVAQSRGALNAQINAVRATLFWSLGLLGLGLIGMAAIQTAYGLWPLRRVSAQIAGIRTGTARRVTTDFPTEVSPMVMELNELLEHNEQQAEAARMHAGNLAHALKTPIAILMNEAAQVETPLARTVRAQMAIMRRHVDHHLARARALGRRAVVNARSPVWPSLEALQRTLSRIHPDVTFDIDGPHGIVFQGERQDFEEMVGNLVDNAGKYGAKRVFVSLAALGDQRFQVIVEDDGPGIPAEQRESVLGRGARIDTEKPGTGLGLSIVKDVAEIYGGGLELGESEDFGGLSARLTLPRAASF